MKVWVCISVLLISLVIPGLSFCEQDQDTPVTQIKQGIVTQIDSIGGLLVMFDGIEQLRFKVAPNAKIMRGVDDITLDDLESNDSVSVVYYKSQDGTLGAVSITDNNVISSF